MVNQNRGVRTSILGMPIDLGLESGDVVARLQEPGVLLSYLNPLAWHAARRHADYTTALESMDIVVCDGLAVQFAVRFFHRRQVSIVSLDYSGIGLNLLQSWSEAGRSVCLVGGMPGVAEKASAKLAEQLVQFRISGAFAGFDEGPDQAHDHILKHRPDVVLAGMGMGLQERFLARLRAEGWQGSGVAVGAFFDRIVNPEIDYPAWSRKANVRFLGNISRRPRYYLGRYLFSYAAFYRELITHLPGGLIRRVRKRNETEQH